MMENNPTLTIQKITPFFLLGLGLLLVFGSGIYILNTVSIPYDISAVPVEVNYPAPELTLKDTDGVTRSLTDYRGQVVLVNLWATWCEPCKKEMPIFRAFYEQYRKDGFIIIAINDGDPEAEVLQFMEEYRLTFPVWLDPTYIATEQAFKTMNLPTSYVIDRNGTVRLSWVGGVDRKTLESSIAPIILEEE